MDNFATFCYATFHGNGGYPGEQARAKKVFVDGNKYLIVGGSIGRCHTDLEFEGLEGTWNSVLFYYDEEKANLKVADYYGNYE